MNQPDSGLAAPSFSWKKHWKQIVFFAIPILIFYCPPPEGLSLVAWRLFGWYVAAIFGLVAKPWSMPVVLLAAVTGSAIAVGFTPNEQGLDMKNVLSGYASTTTWLVFTAFALSTAFVVTGLGRRIAYLMIRSFGSTTLRLGYINTILDLLISPGMPSVTARGGGIMMPIMNSVAGAIGSDPEKKPQARRPFSAAQHLFHREKHRLYFSHRHGTQCAGAQPDSADSACGSELDAVVSRRCRARLADDFPHAAGALFDV